MAYVVTENCINCKYEDCIEVCPVDCFYKGENFLVIHPDECIDCNLCVDQCPVDAIYSDDDVPADQEKFIDINRELAEKWPNVTAKDSALPDADKWAKVKDKYQFLIRG